MGGYGVNDGSGGIGDPFAVTWVSGWINTTITYSNGATQDIIHPGEVGLTAGAPELGLGFTAQNQSQPDARELMMTPDKRPPIKIGDSLSQDVDYDLVAMDSKGKVSSDDVGVHKLELREVKLYDRGGRKQPLGYCKNAGQCGMNQSDYLPDHMTVSGKNTHAVEKRFFIDDHPARIYDPTSKKAYDFVRVDASVKNGFVFTYLNEPPK